MFRMPVNFPPVESSGHSFSGMGTPDILGTHGTFSYYTDYPPVNANNMTGGVVHLVEVISNRVAGQLVGPANSFDGSHPIGPLLAGAAPRSNTRTRT